MLKNDFLNSLSNEQKVKYDYSLVEEDIVGCRTKIRIICNICHLEFEQSFRSHINGHGCRNCQYVENSLLQNDGLDKFVEKAKNVHGDAYEYSNIEYIDSGTKIAILCNTCRLEFKQTPANHLQGHGCSNSMCINRKISNKNKISKDSFLNESVRRFGNIFSYHNYVKKHDNIKIECLKCKHIFERNGRDHLMSLGCPNCSNDKSHGERLIKEFLEENNFVFKREKTFPDLRGVSKFSILRFDFYLPEEMIAIEFDGIHHFEYHSFSKGKIGITLGIDEQKKILENIKMNDRIKDEYCLKNGITMIRIKYDEYNFIERLKYELKKS